MKVFIALLLALFLAGSVSVSLAVDVKITILHTNDVHGHIEMFDSYGKMCDETTRNELCYGGVAKRYTEIQRVRQSEKNILLLDAGDEFQGTLFFTLYRGNATAHFLNLLGYDAMTFGNHEFDEGTSVLSQFVQNVDFPMISANINFTSDPKFSDAQSHVHPYLIKEFDGMKIALIGVTSEDLPTLTKLDKNIKVLSIVDSVRRIIADLRSQGIIHIVLLSHAGLAKDMEIAESVDGISMIVGGHSHTYIPVPVQVTNPSGNTTYIVQSGQWGEYLGQEGITLTSGNPYLKEIQSNQILLDSTIPANSTIEDEVKKYRVPVDDIAKEHVGYTEVDLANSLCRGRECAIGNMAADAYRWFASQRSPDCSIAVINGGGIRASFQRGNVSYGDVLTVFPFSDSVLSFVINGTILQKILELSASRIGHGGMLQISGLQIVYDDKPSLVSAKVLIGESEWEPIDPSRRYRMAATEFLMEGGDGYSIMGDNAEEIEDYGETSGDIIADFFREWSPLHPTVEGRITHVPASPTDNGKNDDDDGSFTIAVISIVSVLILIFVSVIVTGYWMRWRKHKRAEAYSKELSQADVEGSDLEPTEETPIQQQ
eukprot:TRINITY_DN14461_c0_g1_i1.p1 TRINITY_DN14461_c0_g1~~TRINITY_DN14461_c0_g1_i1.p1  ORF type:complete len:599 (-),score=148.68 TRINITY_DN14461_c0_g1_i1:24-1820(-)